MKTRVVKLNTKGDGRSKWFIEWESGRTEVIESSGRNNLRNDKWETWPEYWPKAVVSAFKLPESPTSAGEINRQYNVPQNFAAGPWHQYNETPQNFFNTFQNRMGHE